MRVCSLVPAATEVLFALGLADQVVGVTHECDWPPEAATRRRVTASVLDADELASAEIDQAVSAAAAGGQPLYAVAEDAWDELRPDVVVVQELCEVCAVSADEIDDVVRARSADVAVVTYSPATLDGVGDALIRLGEEFGAADAGREIASDMRARLRHVDATVGAVPSRPRVFVSEWLDPPFAAGHWLPGMVERAGGIDVAGRLAEPSFRMRWADVAALAPDVVVLAPCGFDLDRTLVEVDPVALGADLAATPAGRDARVYAVDANAYFSRPGPRLAAGVELLAHLLHPARAHDPGIPWARLQL